MSFNIVKEYIAAIQKDHSSEYGVTFPDFPLCITAGKTLEEAKNMAKEALQFHIDGIVEDKEEIPKPLTLDEIKKKYKSDVFLIISVKIPTNSKRINITIEENILRKLDKYLEKNGGNRSLFFSQSIEKINYN